MVNTNSKIKNYVFMTRKNISKLFICIMMRKREVYITQIVYIKTVISFQRLGSYLSNSKDYDNAIQIYNKSIKLDKHNSDCYH